MQLKTYTTLILALVISSLSLTAQSFYYEGFAGGAMPAGWTSIDATSVAGEECIFGFILPEDQRVFTDPFMASSTADGFMYADSDIGLTADRVTPHTSQLTTAAIDCSAESTVWLSFENQLGVFTETAETNAIARVSADGTNWTDFTIFPGATETNAWTENPEIVSIDISAVAANQATVFVQWQWTGIWEYTWSIDDINLSSSNLYPAAPNDMRINTFAAIAPNIETPASQVEPFGFIADIENVGGLEQVDIDLVMSVVNSGGTEVFTDFVNYDMIAADSLAENVLFNSEFTPPAVADNYVGTYSLDYTSPDPENDPSNNELSFSFAVTDTTFAKETGRTREVRPADDPSFTYGNVFYVKNATDLDGNQLYARYISFAVHSSVPATMVGKTVNVFLYSWDGTLDPDGRSITEELYSFAGISEYTFVGDEGDDLIYVEVNPGDPLPLEANTYYIPSIQYNIDADNVDFFLEASEDYDYAAMNFYSDSLAVLNNDPKISRYASALDVGNEGTLDIIGFGFDIVPVVRLSIGEAIVTAVEEVQLAAGSVSIFPNPAKEYATVDLALEEVTSGTVQVLDIQGKVVQTHVLNNVKEYRLNLITKDLASGQYTLRVQTELGVSTQKLVVQH